jgi:hypothetical protein
MQGREFRHDGSDKLKEERKKNIKNKFSKEGNIDKASGMRS